MIWEKKTKVGQKTNQYFDSSVLLTEIDYPNWLIVR